MLSNEKLPRILKEPTGWVIIVMVIGFLYMQWPSKTKTEEAPSYYSQTLDSGFNIRWEAEPQRQSNANPQVWGLTLKGMSYLVQTDQLDGSFSELVIAVAEQDRALVGGAVQEPLALTSSTASYSFFDAESRVQEHRWFVVDGQWIKVSVLYKPSSEVRVQRATDFLNHIGF